MTEGKLNSKLLSLTKNDTERNAIKDFCIMMRCLLKHELLRNKYKTTNK